MEKKLRSPDRSGSSPETNGYAPADSGCEPDASGWQPDTTGSSPDGSVLGKNPRFPQFFAISRRNGTKGGDYHGQRPNCARER